MKYKSVLDNYTEKFIEPVGVFNENNFWYIIGYCLLRKGYRNFKIDRIQDILKTSLDFVKDHGGIDAFRKPQDF